MSDRQLDPDIEPHERPVNWWLIGLGMVLFGIGDFFYWAGALDRGNLIPGLILVGITVAAAAIFLALHRSISLGIAAGYVVMTLVSAGECTWTFDDPLADGAGAFAALILYPIAVVIVGIVAIVVTVADNRKGPG